MNGILCVLASLLLFVTCSIPAVASLNLILPTRNHNLYEHPENFYMHTARSGPDAWKGGTYGFSRNARHLKGGTVHTRFHEGVDIAPVMRDARGEPLDTVMAIDQGTVVHVNAVAGHSNYGKYVVVRHYWNGAPFYSLYAHLNETWVDSGQDVRQGAPLGRLGYTGAGINRARAHLHFEIAMLVNENFGKWYDLEFGDNRNHHGFYNGMNLAGLNVARLYERLAAEPDMTIRQFIESEHTPFYTVLLPRVGRLDMLGRYPWLLKKSAMPDDPTWEITFDASGLPLSIRPSKKEVQGPVIAWIADSAFPYTYLTKSYARGSKGSGRLTSSGERFMRLVAIEQDSSTFGARPARTVAEEESMEEEWPDEGMAEEEAHAGEEIAEVAFVEEASGPELDEEIAGGKEDDGKTADDESGEAHADIEAEADGVAGETDDVREFDEEESVENEPVTDNDSVTEDGGMAEGGAIPADEEAEEEVEEAVAPGSLSPGRPEESTEEALVSPYHTRGYFFNWRLDGIHWEIDMKPIVLNVPAEGKRRNGAGVDTVMARCDKCARFGISQPRMFRPGDDRTEWAMHIDVADRARFAANAKAANGKVFLIELYIRSDGEESVSTVKMRTAVREEDVEQ